MHKSYVSLILKDFFFLFTLIILIPSIINGQVLQVCCDTTICSSSPVSLTADITGSINLANLQGVTLTDDSYTPIIPIGFQFDFYGNIAPLS